MQNWPENTISADTTMGSARSRSASGNRISGVLPPGSSPTRLNFSAAVGPMVAPVFVLPVKLIVGTSGDRTRRSPVTWPPVMTFATPGGSSSVPPISSAIRALVCAV